MVHLTKIDHKFLLIICLIGRFAPLNLSGIGNWKSLGRRNLLLGRHSHQSYLYLRVYLNGRIKKSSINFLLGNESFGFNHGDDDVAFDRVKRVWDVHILIFKLEVYLFVINLAGDCVQNPFICDF